MEAKFLTGKDVGEAIRDQISAHDHLHWAVAWGSYTPLAKLLVRNAHKFRNVTFGVSFCQTDPDLVDRLVDLDHCYVATRFEGGTFHPKVYAFRSGDDVAVIVGSANFTHGGLGTNLEAATLLTGTMQDTALAELLAFADTSAQYGEPVTRQYADAYRLAWKRAARMPKPPRDPVIRRSRSCMPSPSSSLISMTWTEFVAEVSKSRHHEVTRSLELLRVAQTWFSSRASFRELQRLQRKALAGVLGGGQKAGDDEYQNVDLDREWGWFGSMRGMGDFANRIEENDAPPQQ